VVVMNNARMEQVGTPFEIYNFPQTEFVAQFVGTLNMVPAVIIDAPAGKITVDHHTLETIHPLENYSTGTQIMVAVRPEQFSFANGGQSQNVIQGNIANITFLGSIVRIQVKLGNLLLSMDQFNNPHLKLPELGEEVRICCPKESILVIANPGKN
jgi:putative spermidine/putrescine transport system ATP-binding protein